MNNLSFKIGKGLFAGLGLSFWLLVIGIPLCFTGIGAIIGVPMILGALLSPFVGIVVEANKK